MQPTRRQLLKNLALGTGSVLLTPILRQLHAEAQGSAAKPKRFVFLLQNHGLQSWAVKPPELTRNDRSGVDHHRSTGGCQRFVRSPATGGSHDQQHISVDGRGHERQQEWRRHLDGDLRHGGVRDV